MPKTEAAAHKLDRVRRPRVHITYDVEINGAIVMKEIPFVVGVLADLSGKPEEPLPKVSDRKFVDISRDTFDQVLAGMKPRLAFRVDNKLTGGDTELGVELRFSSMDDFHPEQIVQQVEPLRELAAARRKLSDLLGKMETNDKLVKRLEAALGDSDTLKTLGVQAGVEQPAAAENPPAEGESPKKTEPEK